MFTLKKIEVPAAIKFLREATLYRKSSRGRNRLISLLEKKQKEIAEEEKSIMEEHAKLDEEGTVITTENEEGSSFIVFKSDEDNVLFLQEMEELFQEECSLSIQEHIELMTALLGGLDESEDKLSGNDAYLYDLICTQLEENLG